MWFASCFSDPVVGRLSSQLDEFCLVHVRVSFATLVGDRNYQTAFQEGGRAARVSLADFCSRKIADRYRQNALTVDCMDGERLALEPLDSLVNRRRHHSGFSYSHTPFMLERSDAWSTETDVNFILRANNGTNSWQQNMEQVTSMTVHLLSQFLTCQDDDFVRQALNHVACAVLQNRLREKLQYMNAVAFIADGAILPRKSGANDAPMASPPAIPCKAPEDSSMRQQVEIDLGNLRPFLSCFSSPADENHPTKVTLTGLVVPTGITLIAGGGYHGKSTLLRAIAAGVYDKIPGDGREFCVTVPDAMSIRAEDGRYVNSCNVSAFISNLPTPPGVNSVIDTTHFSSCEASGSTSQAANVSEAMEMGAKVFLVDEDVSAANFMARDGRMRALVMDESITPLLYRVNGMYHTHGISCVVVVGGVGDWLDVPDQVILMNKYVAFDATKKAQSISYQFSYGHVQYAGRGVVHRLEWDNGGTPAPRRPTDSFLDRFNPDRSTVSLLDGGHAISIHRSNAGDQDEAMTDDPSESSFDDDDDGYIDLSRCEQLLGKKPQLFGCGLCVIWLLREAKRNPDCGIAQLLEKLDQALDHGGLLPLFVDAVSDAGSVDAVMNTSDEWGNLLRTAAYVYRPRKFEVGQALCRMRGILMKHLPIEDDSSEEAAAREAERKKRELAELWAARRAKKESL